MSTTKKVIKKMVVLGTHGMPTPQIIANSKLYVQKMTGNANFTSPNPSLAVVSAQIAKLEASYQLSQSRTKGTVSQKNADLKALIILLKALAAYVESIANNDPDHAETIIHSAGMNVKKAGNRLPKVFSAVASKDPGAVILNTKAVSKGVYVYEMSTDPNNANGWTTVVVSKDVKYVKTGLTSGVRYYFRVAVVLKGIQGAWSPVLNVMIP